MTIIPITIFIIIVVTIIDLITRAPSGSRCSRKVYYGPGEQGASKRSGGGQRFSPAQSQVRGSRMWSEQRAAGQTVNPR